MFVLHGQVAVASLAFSQRCVCCVCVLCVCAVCCVCCRNSESLQDIKEISAAEDAVLSKIVDIHQSVWSCKFSVASNLFTFTYLV